MRTYQFQLYPNLDLRRRLDLCLSQSRQIYSEMLERQKQHFQETGSFLSRHELNVSVQGVGNFAR